jgi:hypothetical protein
MELWRIVSNKWAIKLERSATLRESNERPRFFLHFYGIYKGLLIQHLLQRLQIWIAYAAEMGQHDLRARNRNQWSPRFFHGSFQHKL